MKTSIRDIVRRERWGMNRGAHEAEIALSGLASRDWRDEGDDGWNAIVASYFDEAKSAFVLRKTHHRWALPTPTPQP